MNFHNTPAAVTDVDVAPVSLDVPTNYQFFAPEEPNEWQSQWCHVILETSPQEVPIYVYSEDATDGVCTLNVYQITNVAPGHHQHGSVSFYASTSEQSIRDNNDLALAFEFDNEDDVDVDFREIGTVEIQWALDADQLYVIQSVDLKVFCQN